MKRILVDMDGLLVNVRLTGLFFIGDIFISLI